MINIPLRLRVCNEIMCAFKRSYFLIAQKKPTFSGILNIVFIAALLFFSNLTMQQFNNVTGTTLNTDNKIIDNTACL